MSLRGVAKQTLAILERGWYLAPSGRRRELAAWQAAAEAGTCLHGPEELDTLLEGQGSEGPAPRCEVAVETTQQAARHLVLDEGVEDLALLNYASARNAGGGFLNGARAQEEDLSRCSGLYPCLLRAPEYYAYNRARRTLLYSDHLIYSPGVPFFREHSRHVLERPFRSAVITAPAPNAGQALRRDPRAGPAIEAALRLRAGKVLAVAQQHGHRSLLLGAWGCGVFRNDAVLVADAFGRWLEGPRFAGAFHRAVFAMPGEAFGGANLRAFQGRFGG